MPRGTVGDRRGARVGALLCVNRQLAMKHYLGGKLIPGAQLKVYEGAPHGLFLTHMDRFNSDLLAFARD
jgi:hypothetical protein